MRLIGSIRLRGVEACIGHFGSVGLEGVRVFLAFWVHKGSLVWVFILIERT